MKTLISLLVVFIFSCLGLEAQSYKVIANNSVSVSNLTKKDASDYFLKKKKKWPDGSKVAPIDMRANINARKAFTKEVHRKSVSAIKTYWQQTVFAGKGTPPSEKKSDMEVINYIKNTPGSIGYVSASASISGVKTISISD